MLELCYQKWILAKKIATSNLKTKLLKLNLNSLIQVKSRLNSFKLNLNLDQ